jgi:sugar/nucleoside kinase (ribokinase family)
MIGAKYHVVAIGNALVDVLSHASDEFLDAEERINGMKRGAMSLISEQRAVELYASMGPGVESSGGSAGNTMAGFASFGGRGAYIGKVARDQLGEVFRHDLKSLGVDYTTTPLIVGAPTGRCLILVSSDGHRTMNTFLGAAVELGPDDIEPDLIVNAGITYLEGYLFDPPLAKKAFRTAAELAHDAARKVSLSLSDPFCVDRHRDDFRDLVDSHVDILFANEAEIISLCQAKNFDEALRLIKGRCEIAVLTRSEKGSVVVTKNQIIEVPAEPVKKVVDTTGAGDQFAAGFLFGYSNNLPLEACGKLGALAAAEIISHMGPRPETKYSTLLTKAAAA